MLFDVDAGGAYTYVYGAVASEPTFVPPTPLQFTPGVGHWKKATLEPASAGAAGSHDSQTLT